MLRHPYQNARIGDARLLCLMALLWSTLGLAVAVGWAAADPTYTDGIAAIVNKEVITISELNDALTDERKRLRARYSGEELARRLRQKTYQVLNTLIERKLLLQEARAKGFSVSDAEIQRALDRPEIRAASVRGDRDKVRRRIEEHLLLEKLRAFEIQRLVTVSDAEIVRYYQDHQDEFATPPTYRLRQILWLLDNGQDRHRLLDRAEDVYRALQNGADFGDLAKQHSDGPEAARGGALGLVRHDELLAPLARALETMNPGEISPPIQTTLGIHILLLEERIPSEPRPLEHVEQAIKARLFQERAEATFQAWLAELKQKAFIDIPLAEP